MYAHFLNKRMKNSFDKLITEHKLNSDPSVRDDSHPRERVHRDGLLSPWGSAGLDQPAHRRKPKGGRGGEGSATV